MQVTETLHDGLKRSFTVVVPQADLEGKRTAKLTELGRSLRLPGFRPGKVPLTLVRQRYGAAVMAEVLEESVGSATDQVLNERGLRAATQPRVEMVQADPAQDLEFKVDVELLPEIPMPDFKSIQLTRLKTTPDEDAIDKALATLAERNPKLEPIEEERGVETGETLTVDFLGKKDGVPFAGGEGQDADVEIGGQGFVPGFSEGMAGMKAGEVRTIAVTFPADYHAEELKGADVTFDITAKALKRKVPAVVDDAFAASVGVENLEKLRETMQGVMQREFDQVGQMKLKRELLDALAERASFPVPQGMVDSEFEGIWKRVEADQKSGEGDAEDKDKDEDTLRGEYRAIAERRVRLGLLLSEIGRQNNIQVGADEMQLAMRQEAARYPGQQQQVLDFFRKNPQAAEGLRGPIFEEKVVNFILELAQVEERQVAAPELMAEQDAPAATPDEAAPATPASGDAA